MSITIHKADQVFPVEVFLFPGGEVGVKIKVEGFVYRAIKADHHTIIAKLYTANDVMTLVLATDALRRLDPETPLRLFMPYVPYARQDRVCVPGESFSLKAFAALINGLHFAKVTVVDPHSDVVGAVLDNVEIITQLQVVNRYQDFIKAVLANRAVFVSPDAGANKKTSELAKYFAHSEYLRADKKRNLETGEIVETVVYADDLTGQTVVIADDICDGGRTFIELTKVLKAKGAIKVILYVTHGIFSKGLEPLTKGGIDEVFTTDSWPTAGDTHVFDLIKEFPL